MSHLIYNLQRIQTWDETWCLRFNRAIVNPSIRQAFRLISRLGDGIFWYCLMLWLLVEYQAAALLPVFHMVAAGSGLHRPVQMAEAQDTSASPIQSESRDQLRHRSAGPVQLSFRPHPACRGLQCRGAGLLSGPSLAAAAFHRAGCRIASGARTALPQRCAGRDSDRRDHFRTVTKFLEILSKSSRFQPAILQ